MKHSFLFTFPIFTALTIFMSVGSNTALQPGITPKMNPRTQFIQINAEEVHGLAVLDQEHIIITITKHDESGTIHDVLLKITLLQDENGMFHGEESPFGSISYKGTGGIALSADGKTVFVCDTKASRIYEHDAKTGKLRGAIDTAGQPTQVTALADGSLWYLTKDGRLHHYLQNRRTKVILDRKAGKPLALPNATDLAVLAETGEVLVSRPSRVEAVDAESGSTRVLAKGFSHLASICGVMIDGKQVFLIADQGAGTIYLLQQGGSRTVLLNGNDQSFAKPQNARLLDPDRIIAVARAAEERGNPHHDNDEKAGGTDHGQLVLVIGYLDQ